MKKKKLIMIICILVNLILSLFSLNSNAANETFKLNISTEEQNINLGSEFQVTIAVSDLSNQDGLTYIGGKITYDSNIISYVSGKEQFVTEAGDMSELYSVEVSDYNDGGSNIAIYYLDANIKTLKLTFKLNESVNSGQFTIGFIDFIGTNVDNSNIFATAENLQLKLNAKIPVTQVKLDQNEISMYVNETTNLIATVFPLNATNTNIIWTSSNENVVYAITVKKL